jgi:hypothetical protein
MVFYGFQEQAFGTQPIPINQLAADIEADLVGKIEIKGDDVFVTYRENCAILTSKLRSFYQAFGRTQLHC